MSTNIIDQPTQESNTLISKDSATSCSIDDKTKKSTKKPKTPKASKAKKKTGKGSTKSTSKAKTPKPPVIPDGAKTHPFNGLSKKNLASAVEHLTTPLVKLSQELWFKKKMVLLSIVAGVIKKEGGIKIHGEMKDIVIAGELLENYADFSDMGVNRKAELIYFYRNDRWQAIDVSEIKSIVFKLSLKEHWDCSSTKLKNTVSSFFELADAKPERQAGFISFRNGVFDVHTSEFLQHDRSLGIETYADCDYKRDDFHCPAFEKTVKTWSDNNEEREELILFALYIHLANRYDLKLYTEIVGESNTGKSVFMKLIELFLGDECCKYTNLKALETDKHCTAYLIGGLSILIPEAGKNFGTFEVLKSIIGDDKIPFNMKYGAIFYGRLNSVVGVFSNEPMVIPEDTAAMYNRRVLIHFDNSIAKTEQNKSLITELSNELSGIANKLIKYFTPQKIQECELKALSHADKLKTLVATDVVYRFITECLFIQTNPAFKNQFVQLGCKSGWEHEEQEGKIRRAKLKAFDCFALFCSADELKTFSRVTFKNRLLMHLKTKFGLPKGADFVKAGGNKVVLYGVSIKVEDNPLFNCDGHHQQHFGASSGTIKQFSTK